MKQLLRQFHNRGNEKRRFLLLLPAFYEHLHACRREAMGSNQSKSGKINSNSNRNHTWDQTIASVLASVEDMRSMDVPVGNSRAALLAPRLAIPRR